MRHIILLVAILITCHSYADTLSDAEAAYERGDYSTALPLYKTLAEQGDAMAQLILGVMYHFGEEGVPQDYKTALKWYRLAAEQGHAKAQNNLGVMYDNGEGVPQDDKIALKWYRLAAEQGIAEAQYNLGQMYGNGEGVPQDYVRAHMWYNIAASSGDDDASHNRDNIAKRMTPAQIAEAQKLARECIAKNYQAC